MDMSHVVGPDLGSLLATITALLAFIIMDILNRVKALFDSKNSQLKAKNEELESLRQTITDLHNQASQTGIQEVSSFLTEEGF